MNDRQELQFIRLSSQRVFLGTRVPMTGRPGVVVTLTDAHAGKTLSAYAGQLDWRPVAEQGRSWFAYVASDDNGSLALMLNYVDDAGALATTDPIRIPFVGQVRTPRWSHDGRHLAFVSDSSILYIVPDVASALRFGTAKDLRPTRVRGASRPAAFPAWSPIGDHIAYETEVLSDGSRNSAIEVLPINQPTGEAYGVPVVVTGELSGDNEYRPSWSRDGKYIAFFANKVDSGSTRQPVSIGIVEVVLNPRTGQGYRGIVKEGSQRWLASNVNADDMHGPAWTSITEGSQQKDALVYVSHDGTRTDPLVVADVQRWLAQLPREQYETVMSPASDTVSSGSVSSVEMNKKMRFVFTSVKGGNEVVTFRDFTATWAKGPEPTPPVVAAVGPTTVAVAAPPPKVVETIGVRSIRGQYVARAVLFPGFAQFSAGQKAKGTVIAAAGVGGAVLGIVGWLSMGPPLSDGKAAVNAMARDPASAATYTALYTQAKSTYDSERGKAVLGATTSVVAYLFGIIDASMSSSPARGVSLKVARDQRGDGSGANVGFSIAVGHM